MNKITKAQLLATEIERSEELLAQFTTELAKELNTFKTSAVMPLGTFTLKRSKAHRHVTPDGAVHHVPERVRVRFKPSPLLRRLLK